MGGNQGNFVQSNPFQPMGVNQNVGVSSNPTLTNLAPQDFSKSNVSTIVNGENLTDNMVNKPNLIPTIGGYSLDNQLVKSALPDFTTSSAEEAKLNEQREEQYFNIPNPAQMFVNQDVVSPTVPLEKDKIEEFGTVKVAPPSEVSVPLPGGMSNNMGVPVTDKGVPLINLVG